MGAEAATPFYAEVLTRITQVSANDAAAMSELITRAHPDLPDDFDRDHLARLIQSGLVTPVVARGVIPRKDIVGAAWLIHPFEGTAALEYLAISLPDIRIVQVLLNRAKELARQMSVLQLNFVGLVAANPTVDMSPELLAGLGFEARSGTQLYIARFS